MDDIDEPIPRALPEMVWVLGTLVFYVPCAVAASLWIGLSHGPQVLVARLTGVDPVAGLLLGLGVGTAVALGTRLSMRVSPLSNRMGAVLGRMLGPMSLEACVALALLSAVGEELLFRAALQPAIGVVWATLAFAAVHVPVDRDLWPWPLFALGTGALLAGLYEVTGGAIAPIAAHFAINAHNLYLVARRFGDEPEAS